MVCGFGGCCPRVRRRGGLHEHSDRECQRSCYPDGKYSCCLRPHSVAQHLVAFQSALKGLALMLFMGRWVVYSFFPPRSFYKGNRIRSFVIIGAHITTIHSSIHPSLQPLAKILNSQMSSAPRAELQIGMWWQR